MFLVVNFEWKFKKTDQRVRGCALVEQTFGNKLISGCKDTEKVIVTGTVMSRCHPAH